MDEFQTICAGTAKFTWSDTENSIHLIRPNHSIAGYFPLPTAQLSDALGFGQLGPSVFDLLLGALTLNGIPNGQGEHGAVKSALYEVILRAFPHCCNGDVFVGDTRHD